MTLYLYFAAFAPHVSHIFRFLLAHEFSGLFCLLLIEEAGIPIPIPGDSLIALAGARHHPPVLYGVRIILLSSLAAFLGSSLLYTVMRRGGRPLLEKYGKYLHISAKRLNRLETWFNRHGPVAIVLGRLIPGLRIPTTVMAGLSGIPYRVFAPTSALAAVIWASGYFAIGLLLGRQARLFSTFWAGFLDFVSDSAIFLVVLALLLVAGTATWFVRRQLQKNSEPSTSVEDEERIGAK